MDELNEPIDSKLDNQEEKEKLQYSGGILAMGIISIIFSMGFIGIVLAIIALTLSATAIKEYHENPEKYDLQSFKNVKTGKICAIVGLALTGVRFLIFMVNFVLIK